ncbi:flagellar export protein FliJ [Halobacillus halophilus]|uniref:Flagellar FliJ protein n=1 Tax=Halobacillus halophilus (strain ATCC 35676 / DSM 2266 / JCM 20832 / KCTC 3685 / LMG 17431 / NBRC 102448 / NCIMB 2269) TaxID=866895 RepID=I0JML3_HALH3|nr:flagellar export protein FliJ [Halobacillus halophilus]ASF39464.1 flagellar export protein FliJ [Halobacillus halophilus]CCG45383.1 flagellar biosynthesis chaperone [Halobacillus halophilus DSM 2266]
MAHLRAFHKIKDLRDRERTEQEKQHQSRVETFEQKATQLYEVLKEKEEAEQSFHQTLSKRTIQAMTFIQHQQYIERLEERIDSLQPEVQDARQAMYNSQEKLTDAYVEVKKFEKLIEQKQKKHQKWVKDEENKQMDDLSMRQFLNFQSR